MEEGNLRRKRTIQWSLAVIAVIAMVFAIIFPFMFIGDDDNSNNDSGDGGIPPIGIIGDGDGLGDGDGGNESSSERQTFPNKYEAWGVMESSSAGMYSNTWTWNSKTDETNNNIASIFDNLSPNTVYYGWYSTLDYRAQEEFLTFQQNALTTFYTSINLCINIISNLPPLVDYPDIDEFTNWYESLMEYLGNFNIVFNDWKNIAQSLVDQFLATSYGDNFGFITVSFYEYSETEVYIEASYNGSILITQAQIDSSSTSLPNIYHFDSRALNSVGIYYKTLLGWISDVFTNMVTSETFEQISGINISFEQWNEIVKGISYIAGGYGVMNIVKYSGDSLAPPGWLPPEWTPPGLLPPGTIPPDWVPEWPPEKPPGWTPPDFTPGWPPEFPSGITPVGTKLQFTSSKAAWGTQSSYSNGEELIWDIEDIWSDCTPDDPTQPGWGDDGDDDWYIDSVVEACFVDEVNVQSVDNTWGESLEDKTKSIFYTEDPNDPYQILEDEVSGFDSVFAHLTEDTMYAGWYAYNDFRNTQEFLDYRMAFNQQINQKFVDLIEKLSNAPSMIGDYPTSSEFWDFHGELNAFLNTYGYHIKVQNREELVMEGWWRHGDFYIALHQFIKDTLTDIMNLPGVTVGYISVITTEKRMYTYSGHLGEIVISAEDIYNTPEQLPPIYEFDTTPLNQISLLTWFTARYRSEIVSQLFDPDDYNWSSETVDDTANRLLYDFENIARDFWIVNIVDYNS